MGCELSNCRVGHSVGPVTFPGSALETKAPTMCLGYVMNPAIPVYYMMAVVFLP